MYRTGALSTHGQSVVSLSGQNNDQWRRKIFFYGNAHTFPAIVVASSILFHYSEVGRVPEPSGSKTSLATTRTLGLRFIVYSPFVRD